MLGENSLNMNNKKICFITAVNNTLSYIECLFYISRLKRPEGFGVEIISIRDASSIASAYNNAQSKSDAIYKVYLHQDVFIINENFIYDIMSIFESNKSVGMIGVCGTKKLFCENYWQVGKVYESSVTGKMSLLSYDEVEQEYEEVLGIDGLIMITQYDLRWREDVFDGWDFYDLSQSIEFIKNKYKVVIPNQKKPWCVHDSGLLYISDEYYKYRKMFIDIYSEFIDTDKV
ncbi:hypothetical protein IC175_15480 [Clostridioides sp. ES-S-0123-01]|nr:hypothetical protein [Clostridioides sp. ES-S-0123-01]